MLTASLMLFRLGFDGAISFRITRADPDVRFRIQASG